MALNSYHSPQQDSLSPAYQLLLQATLAKAQAVGGALDPFVAAIRGNRQEALQGRALDAREKEAAAETAWKERYAGQQDRSIGLRERELNTEEARNAAWAHAQYSDGPGPQAPATPFQSGSPAQTRMAPESLLGGGGQQLRHVDEATARALGPQLTMHLEAQHDRQEQLMAKQAEAQRKAQQDADQLKTTSAMIDSAEQGGALDPASASAFRIRLTTPGEATKIGEELTKSVGAHVTETHDEAMLKGSLDAAKKRVKKDFPNDPAKGAQIEALIELFANSPGKAAEKSKALEQELSKLYGVGEKKDTANSPLKFLADDPVFAKGGIIESAPAPTKANVKLQAMTMAQQNGMLRNDTLTLASGNPNFDKLVSYYDKMDAAEKQAVSTFESLIWQRGGWKPLSEAMSAGEVRPQDATGAGTLPFQGQGATPQATPQAVAPQSSSSMPALSELTPKQRDEALRLYKTGDKAALRSYLIKARGESTAGSRDAPATGFPK